MPSNQPLVASEMVSSSLHIMTSILEFDARSELSKTESQISYGNRISQFGFTDMFGLSKTTQPQ